MRNLPARGPLAADVDLFFAEHPLLSSHPIISKSVSDASQKRSGSAQNASAKRR